MSKRMLIFLVALLPLLVQAETIDARLFKNDVCGFYTVVQSMGSIHFERVHREPQAVDAVWQCA